MKLIPIFVDKKSAAGLYAIQYKGQELNEFERLFDLWSDADYLYKYLKANSKYFDTEYFEGMTIAQAIHTILNEASVLSYLLNTYCVAGFSKCGKNLQMLFSPLNDKVYRLLTKQESKAKLKGVDFRKPLLRIYAIRINANTFIITGGAIKLTKRMEDHEGTRAELQKVKQVKSFLDANQIDSIDDIIYYYEKS
jgi:hypothetical protein